MSVFTEKSRSIRVAMTSGFAGGATLAGEVLGARLLRPIVGSTSLSQAGAVAGVLGGLGAGAWWASRWLERGRDRSPRRVLEAAMVALGVLTFVAPWVARLLATPSARMLVALTERSTTIGAVAQLAVALVLTVPFGVLAGAAYPSLAALHGAGAGRATAVSGAASSFGAAAMVLIATFGLAPALGVHDSLMAVAVVYAVAFGFARTFDAKSPAEPDSKRAGKPVKHDVTLLVGMVLVGIASTTWQLALSRLGVLAFGASAFALGAAIAAHTASLAIGEAAAAGGADRVGNPRAVLGFVLAAAGGLVLAATSLGARLPAWSGARFEHGAPAMGSLWTTAFGLLLVVMVPVVVPIGASIPLGARIAGDDGAPRAHANAAVLGAMAIGNVVGALLIGLALLPLLTLAGAMLACGALLALAAAVIAWPSLRTRPRVIAFAAVAVVAGCVLARRVQSGWDVTSLSQGPFLYTGAEDLDLGQIARITYGREATVAVRRDQTGAVILQIDGKVDATSGGDMATQMLVGIAPAVLANSPREALVIGLGSGMTVDAVRDVPGVRHVDVTELLPEVIDAARTDFRAANHAVLDAPNVRTLRQDASLYLRGTRRMYDLIVSEPSNPWVAGMADLFTLDALEAARDRLTRGGVMAAWFHAYSTDAATVAGILATFQHVFPHAALIEMVSGQDYMVVGMLEPVHVDVEQALARLADPRVVRDLAACGIEDRGAFFGRFIAGSDGLSAIAREGELMRADDLRLEFRAPALLYNDASTDIFALFARAQDLPLAGLSPSGAQYTAVLEESEPAREAALHTRQMAVAREAREYDAAIHEGEQAVAANPRDASVRTQLARIYLRRAGRRYRTRDPAGAEDDVRNAIELQPAAAERFRAQVVLGDMALAHNDFPNAAHHYGEALEIVRLAEAQAPELHVRMAQVLISLGDLPHARAELDRAVRDCSDARRLHEIEALRDRVADEVDSSAH